MLVAGIETSTLQSSVALGTEQGTVASLAVRMDRARHEVVAEALRHLLDWAGTPMDSIGGVAVGLGPGLFTGLRVGVTTAKTMSQALRVPVVGVTSLDLVAYPVRHTNRLVAAVLDARRGEVFHARYRPVPGGVQRVTDYEVGVPDDLVADLVAAGEEVLFAGDGALRYREELAGVDRSEQAGAAFAFPSGAALVELATARMEREEFSSMWEVQPLYLRQSDAEIEWERRQAS